MEAKIYWKWVIRTIPELFLGLLMWASQVTPDQASSNIASWLLFFGISEPPAWAANRAIDKWVFWGGLVCAIAWGVFLWVRSRKSKKSAAELLYGKKWWLRRWWDKTFELRMVTDGETPLDRLHNKRGSPLRIKFSNTNIFKHIGDSEGHGLQRGQLQMYRVMVHNATDHDIDGVQVWLTDIKPRPSELHGVGDLPLHITHAQSDVSAVMLRKEEKRFVDVVSFVDKFWNPRIRIEHTSPVANHEIYKGDEGYEIELEARGNAISSFRRRFKMGVTGRDLYMISLEQTEDEAMVDRYSE